MGQSEGGCWKPLNADESKYAHGAFVYLMQDGSKNFFGLIRADGGGDRG